jgi:hypothetical protein
MRLLLITLFCIGLGVTPSISQDINDTQMGTPTCVTYPEWTGQSVDDIDLTILGDRSYRILKPDSMMTMDYIPDRLKIKTDDVGIIITTDCG